MKAVRIALLCLLSCRGLLCAEEMGSLTQWLPSDIGAFYFMAGTPTAVLTPITPDIVQLSIYPDGQVVPDPSDAVILGPQGVIASYQVVEDGMSIQSGNIGIGVAFDPVMFGFSGYDNTITWECRFFWNGDERGVGMGLNPNDRIYGGGERALPLNRCGQMLNSYNAPQYCYGNGTADMNITIPFLMSANGWGIFFDDPYPATIDVGATNPARMVYTAEGGKLSFYIIAGNNPAEVLAHYTELTGRQPLPPLWSLGYMQSRYGYHNSGEVRALVNVFRNNHIPLDAVILDLYWFGGTQGMGNFTWDQSAWPNPPQFLSDMRDQDVNIVLITEPYVVQASANYNTAAAASYFGEDSTGNPLVMPNFWAGSASLLDVTNTAAADWMWNFYSVRTAEGVAGWWCDLGEPELHPAHMHHSIGSAARAHNVFSLLWAKRIYQGFQTEFPNKRLFNLIRSGYAGMQRYSTFPWSGDVQRQFSGMQAQIPIMLSMGLSGVPFIGSDLGGFDCGAQDTDLYLRWLQMGAFSPVMRAHGVGATTEPVYFDPVTREIAAKYIRLRYALLPYNYTLAWEATRGGTPLARPLFWNSLGEFTQDFTDEYLWGDAFLVAPVFENGSVDRYVFLPPGSWYNFWNDQLLMGNNWITAAAPLDELPLYVKAGSFIPMIPPIEATADYDTDTLLVHVYPDPLRTPFTDTMYVDDGVTPNAFSLGTYEWIEFGGSMPADDLIVHLSRDNSGFAQSPLQRKMTFIIHAVSDVPRSVHRDGIYFPQVFSESALQNADSAFYYDAESRRLSVGFRWNNAGTMISVNGFALSASGPNPVAKSFSLNAAPNPFNETTTLRFDVPVSGRIKLEIFDLLGRSVKVLADRRFVSGSHLVEFDAGGLSSGVYLCRLSAAQGVRTVKLMLVK